MSWTISTDRSSLDNCPDTFSFDKALQLAPALGPAHAAHAYLQFYSFDHRGALAECRRAVQLAPTDGTVLNGCGYVLGGIGKLREAIRLREQLLSTEPLYTVNYYQYARLLATTGQLDKATKYLRIADDLPQPESLRWNQHMHLAIVRGDVKTAHEIARHQPSPAGNEPRDRDANFPGSRGG